MTVIADIDTELAAWDIHTLRGYAEEIELGNNSTTTTTGEPIEWTRAGSPISTEHALELMHAEIGRRREAITINTPLVDIAYDDATGSIGEDLISTAIAGDDWGGAWDRVARAAGTVADLRDELYGAFWDLDPSRAWVRFMGEQTVSEWRADGGATTAAEIAQRYLVNGPFPVRDPAARDHLARLLAQFIETERPPGTTSP